LSSQLRMDEASEGRCERGRVLASNFLMSSPVQLDFNSNFSILIRRKGERNLHFRLSLLLARAVAGHGGQQRPTQDPTDTKRSESVEERGSPNPLFTQSHFLPWLSGWSQMESSPTWTAMNTKWRGDGGDWRSFLKDHMHAHAYLNLPHFQRRNKQTLLISNTSRGRSRAQRQQKYIWSPLYKICRQTYRTFYRFSLIIAPSFCFGTFRSVWRRRTEAADTRTFTYHFHPSLRQPAAARRGRAEGLKNYSGVWNMINFVLGSSSLFSCITFSGISSLQT